MVNILMANQLFKLINGNDYKQIREVLVNDPALANEGVPLNDHLLSQKGHPLHRICDAVFAKKTTDEQAIETAKILLEFGASIDGYKSAGDNNTPLIAAASLHAEELGIFYIEQGADIFYTPKSDGATALHWAAFCGRDKLVTKLTEKGANINQPDTLYNSTPTGWAIHALLSKNNGNVHHQLQCIKFLLKAGADKSLLNSDSMQYLHSVAGSDKELEGLIK
jgi:ankyrin repeat protein